jgi:hypothetical protein
MCGIWNIYGIRVEYVWNMCGQYARMAALRVLTAYIPQTPGPKKTTRAWPEPGLLPFGAMEYAWNMYGIYMEYVWNMRGTWGDMHGICTEYVWNIFGICMEYVWNM